MLNLSNVIKWYEGGNLSFFCFLYTRNDLEQQWCRGVKLQQTQVHGQKNYRSFSSSKNSHFQYETKCKTLLVKMSFIYKRIHINSFKWDRKNVNMEQNTDPSLCMETSRLDTKSCQYKSFWYKLKQWNFTNIRFTSSIVCEWTRKTFWVNIFSLSQVRGTIYTSNE